MFRIEAGGVAEVIRWLKIIFACVVAVLGYGVVSDLLSPPRFYGDGGDIALCILIVICTAQILNKMESQKPKDQDKKEQDEETTP